MWVLKVDFFRAPPVSQRIQRDFDDLRVRLIDPSSPFFVEPDMLSCYGLNAHTEEARPAALSLQVRRISVSQRREQPRMVSKLG
jgi:hypothetical protein